MSTLRFRDLRDTNLARCARWHPNGLGEWSLSDWAVATSGELGEALNVLKKLNRERDGLTGNAQTYDELVQAFADELADTLIYLDLLAAAAGVDLERAVISKFNRVSERNNFPERLAFGSETEGEA